MQNTLLLLLVASLALCSAQMPPVKMTPAEKELTELTEQQLEAARNATERPALPRIPAFAPAPAPEDMADAPLDQDTARRLLLSTLTVNVSQGDVWAYSSRTQTERTEQVAPSGTRKTSVGTARGQALAVNGVECFLEDCDKPIAEVTTSVTPATSVSGPQATADAFARGSKISATRVNTTSLDIAQNGDSYAVARGSSGASSWQEGGLSSRSFSTVQANAAAGPDSATWSATGQAFNEPAGDYGKHKSAFVTVEGRAFSGRYGRR